MGCGVSNVRHSVSKQNIQQENAEMKLSSCKLIFSQHQLRRLNWKFSSLLDVPVQRESTKEKQTARLGVVVERLIQRLVCTVGNLDSRFSSKFLINLEPTKSFSRELKKGLKYKYLVRLDLLSTPALYPESYEPPVSVSEGADHQSLPQGFARVRIHGEYLEQWAGFMSSNGFLRRDKVQEKFLELLTRAAARPSEPYFPAEVDESRYCGSPGKIVDPITLSHILRNPPTYQVFFGSAECNESRFPDPRDFRIAIVEGVPEIRLHISFLSPTAQSITSEDVEVTITLGIGVTGWPNGTDFPSRLPLDHIDVMLGYRAAQLGYYLAPKGPHPSLYCEDRSSVWEIRALPTEMFLEHHYSSASVVARVFKILTNLLEILKARGVKTINKYILKNLLFFELENKNRIQQWKPSAISRRVISILEQLLVFLRNQTVPCYIFPEKNILLQEDVFDDDYASDRDILERYLVQLHNDEFRMESENKECTLEKDELENMLLKKWDNVVGSMLPPQSNRTKRLNVMNNSPAVISYTQQQMEYVALLIREVLNLKNIQKKCVFRGIPDFKTDVKEEQTDKEDFIYLLQIMFDQAKQKLLTASKTSLYVKKIPSKKFLKQDQLLLRYDLSTAMLLEDIRRSNQADYKFTDDLSIVSKIIECLYKAMDSNGKIVGLVLRPYLNQIFKGSHENCCFLFEWNKRADFSEFEAIGVFSNLVLTGNLSPLDGILNSANKGWNWAVHCLQIMEEIAEENSTKIIIGEKIDFTDPGVNLIFTPSLGKTLRINVTTLNQTLRKTDLEETLNEKNKTSSRYSTIKSFQNVLESNILSVEVEKSVASITNLKLKNEKQPLHVQLRDENPFTLASIETRRFGHYRGLGSIVQALISLQKLTILQEISQYLPEDERIRVLSDIKKLSKEVQRAAVENSKKKSLSPSGRQNRFIIKRMPGNTFLSRRISQKNIAEVFSTKISEPRKPGIYRSISEFSISGEKEEFQNTNKNRNEQIHEESSQIKKESLRGTCRQLRKGSRPVVGQSTSYAFSRAEFYQKPSSTFLRSAIKTPFYTKVSSQECKFVADPYLSNTLKQ